VRAAEWANVKEPSPEIQKSPPHPKREQSPPQQTAFHLRIKARPGADAQRRQAKLNQRFHVMQNFPQETERKLRLTGTKQPLKVHFCQSLAQDLRQFSSFQEQIWFMAYNGSTVM
jgi:hypothetical protein